MSRSAATNLLIVSATIINFFSAYIWQEHRLLKACSGWPAIVAAAEERGGPEPTQATQSIEYVPIILTKFIVQERGLVGVIFTIKKTVLKIQR